MNVGQLKQLIEFVKDDTQIYTEDSISGVFGPATVALDFVVEGATPNQRLMADPEYDTIDNEIALVIW